MLIRYFAGAAEAAGVDEQQVELTAGLSVADLIEQLSAGNARLAAVLKVSALLIDAQRCTDRSRSLDGATVIDVLPPFAGG